MMHSLSKTNVIVGLFLGSLLGLVLISCAGDKNPPPQTEVIDTGLPTVHRIADLLAAEELPTGKLMLHFTNEEWSNITRDLPVVDIDSLETLPHFDLVAFPNVGGKTATYPDCIPPENCREIYRRVNGYLIRDCKCNWPGDSLLIPCQRIGVSNDDITCAGRCASGGCTPVRFMIFKYPNGTDGVEAIACLCRPTIN